MKSYLLEILLERAVPKMYSLVRDLFSLQILLHQSCSSKAGHRAPVQLCETIEIFYESIFERMLGQSQLIRGDCVSKDRSVSYPLLL